MEWIESTSNVNMADYENLGTVMARGTTLDDSVKEKLHPKVCEWGGNAVSIAMTAGTMGINRTQFNVLRKRDNADEPPAELPCTGKYVNDDGAELTFAKGGKTTMAFGGNTADCTAQSAGGSKVTLACSGNTITGDFASDCSTVSYGGMAYKRAE